ncbi:MAG: ubiquitin-like domain-containing protein, partial [Clostridia bacterium]|nr:ubiquitin-like domain-containing protein [Clostridia bacterium]
MRLIDKVVNRYSKWRIAITLVVVMAVMAQFVSGAVYAMSKQVSIVDSLGSKRIIKTYLNNAADVLEQQGICLNEGDEVSPS